eukprot:5335535-Prymnesium_polylepis.1
MSLPLPLLAMRPLGRVGSGPPEPRSPAVRAVGVAAPDLGQLLVGSSTSFTRLRVCVDRGLTVVGSARHGGAAARPGLWGASPRGRCRVRRSAETRGERARPYLVGTRHRQTPKRG